MPQILVPHPQGKRDTPGQEPSSTIAKLWVYAKTKETAQQQ